MYLTQQHNSANNIEQSIKNETRNGTTFALHPQSDSTLFFLLCLDVLRFITFSVMQMQLTKTAHTTDNKDVFFAEELLDTFTIIIARLLYRSPSSQFDSPLHVYFYCPR